MKRESRADRLFSQWNAFWHAEASPYALGLFRILFAYCLFEEVATTSSKSSFAIAGGGFHLPYSSWIPLMPEGLYGWVHQAQYPLIVLLGLGILSRTSCALLLFLQGWVFFADQLNFRNHPYFFLLVLLLLMLSPAGQAVALGPLWRAWKKGQSMLQALLGPPRPVTMQRLIQVQVCLAYIFAGLHKLRPAYLEGQVLHRILIEDLPSRTSGYLLEHFISAPTMEALFQTGWVFPALAIATVCLELGIPVALWLPAARPFAIALGTAFHLGIALVMEIHVFSYAVIASYLLFLENPPFAKAICRIDSKDSYPADFKGF